MMRKYTLSFEKDPMKVFEKKIFFGLQKFLQKKSILEETPFFCGFGHFEALI